MIILTSPEQIDLRADFLLLRRVQHDVELVGMPGVITADEVVQAENGIVGVSRTETPAMFEVVRVGPGAAAEGIMAGDTVLLDSTYCRVHLGNEIQLVHVGREKLGILPLAAVAGHVRASAEVQ